MLTLDHLIIAAKEPALAATKFGEKHSVKTIEGGKHDNWGTYNYLAYFDNDCYIEWLGVFDKEKAEKSDNPLIRQLLQALEQQNEGPINFALRTNQMNKYVANFHQKNIPFTGPIQGSRQKPDGTKLEWRMLFPNSSVLTLPFLIEWGKEKNNPSNTSFINQKQINTITTNVHSNEYDSIYGLSFHDNIGQLENGSLYASSNEVLDFTMN